MNRREFLRTAGLSAGGVELLGAEILVPERTYFLPPRGGWPLGDVRRYWAVGDGISDDTGYQEWRWSSEITTHMRERFKAMADLYA